jgi:hypothetical protein
MDVGEACVILHNGRIELRELAELKAKEVNHAYAVAKKQRRFN